MDEWNRPLYVYNGEARPSGDEALRAALDTLTTAAEAITLHTHDWSGDGREVTFPAAPLFDLVKPTRKARAALRGREA